MGVFFSAVGPNADHLASADGRFTAWPVIVNGEHQGYRVSDVVTGRSVTANNIGDARRWATEVEKGAS